MENSVKKILGIDYGERKVGLAIADTETRMAFAFDTLDGASKNFLENLKEIIRGENVEAVVIGIPSHINRVKVEYPGERLGKRIAAETGIKVFYQNEMFTTKMAKAHLLAKGVRGVDKVDDQEAARIILQEWLDGASI
ncbi:MAG TPA: Holliday junction resolvase RuvX [Candidatus Moranbacteria bacterium]|nr:Holliday junction resolvase RuvX [Candidatus Moranbacteria bacterium]